MVAEDFQETAVVHWVDKAVEVAEAAEANTGADLEGCLDSEVDMELGCAVEDLEVVHSVAFVGVNKEEQTVGMEHMVAYLEMER